MEIYRAVDVKPSTKKYKVLLGHTTLVKGDIVIMVGWSDPDEGDGNLLVRLADSSMHVPNQIVLGDCEEEEFRPIELHAKPLPLFVKKTPGGPVDEADKWVGKEVPSAFQNQESGTVAQTLQTYKNVCEQQGLEIRRLNASCDELKKELEAMTQSFHDVDRRYCDVDQRYNQLLMTYNLESGNQAAIIRKLGAELVEKKQQVNDLGRRLINADKRIAELEGKVAGTWPDGDPWAECERQELEIRRLNEEVVGLKKRLVELSGILFRHGCSPMG